MKRHLGYGFTLIEMLVVIVIIMILAAIMFPIVARARESGNMTACMNNQQQISKAILQYAQDHQEALPEAATVLTTLDLGEQLYRCPTQVDSEARGYAMSHHVSSCLLSVFQKPAEVILLADAANAENPLTSSDTLEYRHARRWSQVVYLDGHSGRVAKAEALSQLIYLGEQLRVRKEVSERFGFPLVYDTEEKPRTWIMHQRKDLNDLQQAIKIFLREMSLYPPAFFRAKPATKGNSPTEGWERIALADSIIWGEDLYRPTDEELFYKENDWWDYRTSVSKPPLENSGTTFWLRYPEKMTELDNRLQFRRELHHAIYHALWNRIGISDAAWEAMNPPDFTYHPTWRCDIATPDEHVTGAMTERGLVNPTEDQAEIYSYLMTDPLYLFQRGSHDATIKAKTDFLRARMAAYMPYFDDIFWKFLVQVRTHELPLYYSTGSAGDQRYVPMTPSDTGPEEMDEE